MNLVKPKYLCYKNLALKTLQIILKTPRSKYKNVSRHSKSNFSPISQFSTQALMHAMHTSKQINYENK